MLSLQVPLTQDDDSDNIAEVSHSEKSPTLTAEALPVDEVMAPPEEDQEMLQQLKHINMEQLLNIKQEEDSHDVGYRLILNAEGIQLTDTGMEAGDVRGVEGVATQVSTGDAVQQQVFQLSEDGQVIQMVDNDGQLVQIAKGK